MTRSSRLAAGFAVVALIGIALHIHATASTLNEARKHAVSAQAGREACLSQELSGVGTVPSVRVAFVAWVKQHLPPGAVYELSPYAGAPDGWCVTEVLLPALPAGPGAAPTWTIVTDDPSAVASLEQARHRTLVFAPGYALVRTGS